MRMTGAVVSRTVPGDTAMCRAGITRVSSIVGAFTCPGKAFVEREQLFSVPAAALKLGRSAEAS